MVASNKPLADSLFSAGEQKKSRGPSLTKKGSQATVTNKSPSHKTSRPPHSRQKVVAYERGLKGIAQDYARSLCALSTMVEYKAPIPKFRGISQPTILSPPTLEYKYDPTSGSTLLKDTFSRMFGDRHYKFRLGTNLHMSSSGAGIINSAINISSVGALSEFTSLTALFNEFFVVKAVMEWEPASMYNGPIGYLPASTVSSLGIGVISLQHGAAAVSTISAATNSYEFGWHNSGRPFTYTWHNPEDPSTGVVIEGATATQAWCLTSNSSAYSGQVQIISDVTPVLPNTAILGSFIVQFDVIFRLRQ